VRIIRAPEAPRRYLVSVVAAVHDNQLWLAWSYVRRIHHPATIEKLAGKVV